MEVILEIWDGHSIKSCQKIAAAAKLLGLKCVGHSDYDMNRGFKLLFVGEGYDLKEWEKDQIIQQLTDPYEDFVYERKLGSTGD